MGQHSKRDALNELIEEIFQANGSVLAEGDRLSSGHGLTGARWQVLGALHLEQRPLTVAQIARRMGLQRQSVQRLTDILVDQGLLAYRANPEHKRAKLVDFTPKGESIIQQMDEIQQRWASGITGSFSSGELQQAIAVLQKLRHLIDKGTDR
jgi:DNA-binding MarR family transcriptional regulator